MFAADVGKASKGILSGGAYMTLEPLDTRFLFVGHRVGFDQTERRAHNPFETNGAYNDGAVAELVAALQQLCVTRHAAHGLVGDDVYPMLLRRPFTIPQLFKVRLGVALGQELLRDVH